MASFSDHLQTTRHEAFTGRAPEIKRFERALRASEPPFRILFVEGPGGIGKTSLLHEYQRISREEAISACYVDLRAADASPREVTASVKEAGGLEREEPLRALAGESERLVLILDSYEAVASLDYWMRSRFVPALPEGTLLIIGSRIRFAQRWRSEHGLSPLVQSVALDNLSEADSRKYLASQKVPEAQHEKIVAFTHGHPLALSLIADLFRQNPHYAFNPAAAPDVIKALLNRIIREVPSPDHRTALELSALVRYLTEPLLESVLETGNVFSLFEWLRQLSFVETGPHGIFPHDAAREAITADLQWRNSKRYKELHRRAQQFYLEELKSKAEESSQSILGNYLYLLRHSPVVGPLFQQLKSSLEEASTSYVRDHPNASDWPALQEMVQKHEGGRAVEIFEYWRARQPDAAIVFRSPDGTPEGFLWPLSIENIDDDARRGDPAAQAACRYLEAEAPLREGERATLFRFWMSRSSYQEVSRIQALIFVETVKYYLSTPRLAFTFLPCAEPQFWHLPMSFANMERLGEADFRMGERQYGMFGHDWRATPPAEWLDLLSGRDVDELSAEEMSSSPRVSVAILSQDEFARQVKAALQDYHRADLLKENPLLSARLVLGKTDETAGAAKRVEVLRALIRDAADLLSSSGQEAKYFRALSATYLDPYPTQEKAAEYLGLPFSTFRRHLRRGIEHVQKTLWRRELQSSSPG